MANRCAICTHPKRREIDEALVGATVPFRTIGTRYGMSHVSAIRHMASHIPELLAEAHEAEVMETADTLHTHVRRRVQKAAVVIERAELLLARAENDGDLELAIKAFESWRKSNADVDKVLELLGRVTGELKDRQTNVAVLVAHPEWLTLRTRIVAALDAHPEARDSVLAALGPAEDTE